MRTVAHAIMEIVAIVTVVVIAQSAVGDAAARSVATVRLGKNARPARSGPRERSVPPGKTVPRARRASPANRARPARSVLVARSAVGRTARSAMSVPLARSVSATSVRLAALSVLLAPPGKATTAPPPRLRGSGKATSVLHGMTLSLVAHEKTSTVFPAVVARPLRRVEATAAARTIARRAMTSATSVLPETTIAARARMCVLFAKSAPRARARITTVLGRLRLPSGKATRTAPPPPSPIAPAAPRGAAGRAATSRLAPAPGPRA